MTYTSVTEVIQEIKDNGGLRAAELLDKLFGENSRSFHADNPTKFFEVTWDKLLEKWNAKEDSETTGNNFLGIGNKFNIFPSLNANGVCSELSLSLVPMGFYKISMGDMLKGGKNNINFYKAFLLLAEYWFTCLPLNRENLILVGNWNPVYFDFFRAAIESYCSYGKKVFIVEVSTSGLILQYSI